MNKPIKSFLDNSIAVHKARPFTIQAKPDNDKLVIIIHGFTSSPYRMHHLADFLAEQGYDIETALLAGHANTIDHLSNSNADDWYRSAEHTLIKNLDKYKNIYIVGYSFGANIGIRLINNYPQVKALVSLGIPIFLKKERSIRFFLPLANLVKNKYRKRWINKNEADWLAARGHHTHIPIKSLFDFYGFIDNCTKKDIYSFNKPILIIHSRYDLVADPRSSEFLFDNVASDDKNLFILNKGNHQLEDGQRKDAIAKKTLEFISKY